MRFADRARAVLLLACGAFAFGAGTSSCGQSSAQPANPQPASAQPANAQPADAQSGVVGASTLPRLRAAWTATNLRTTQWRYGDTAPTFDGVLIAWGSGEPGREGSALVAVELSTGRERWRVAAPRGPDAQIEFATGVVLVNAASSGMRALDPAHRPSGETTAIHIKTGKTLWRATLCNFSEHVVDNGTVGFALCHGPPVVHRDRVGAIRGSTGSTMLVAFELVSGRVLWQRQPWPGQAPAIGGPMVFLPDADKLVVLDPVTGREVQKVSLPPTSPYQPWSVTGAAVAGRPLALVNGGNGGGDGLRTNLLAALELPDGRLRWSRPYPQGRSHDVLGTTVRGGRLFEEGSSEVTEIDAATGRPVLDCPLPRVHESNNYPRRWRLMRGEVVVMMDAGERPAVFIRCARGHAPKLAMLPRPADTNPMQLVAVDDGIVVRHAGNDLVAHDIFKTDLPEAVALSPIQRLEAILDRAHANPFHTAESLAANRTLYDEIRAGPDYERHLLSLASQSQSRSQSRSQSYTSRRHRAVEAATALRIPGVVKLLLGEIFDAPPMPAPLTEKQIAALAASRGQDPASSTYEQSLARRSSQIEAVAALDDASAAERLGPLLLARSTPEGLGWWDANVWMSEHGGYGGAWDGATRSERRSHDQHVSTEEGYSETLPATVGRSSAHAAIYRLLARVGRPAGLAHLDNLHRGTTRAGGWSAICDVDDAVKQRGPERMWVDPWGLCRGIEIGDYRVTQARNIIWLRRRLRGGSYGPPAWAADPGGNQCGERRTMQKAVLRGRRIVVRGVNGHDHDTVIGTVDPAGLFADADRDGLTDRTEAAFGTDPKRADTDGDGVPDGRDPAPLAATARDGGDDVTAEILRYAALFLVGGPLIVQGDDGRAGGGANAAGVLLHLAREAQPDDQVCESAGGRTPGERDKVDGAHAARPPFAIMRIESLHVEGDRARCRLVWSHASGRRAVDLGLARVHHTWRVVDDRRVLAN